MLSPHNPFYKVHVKSCGDVAEMDMREKQTIVEPWPLRLTPNADNEEALLKFEVWMASGDIEWIRVALKSGQPIRSAKS